MQLKKRTKTEPLGRLSSVSAEQPWFRPKEATFPLDIDTGFIVIAAGASHNASLGNLYSMQPSFSKGYFTHFGEVSTL